MKCLIDRISDSGTVRFYNSLLPNLISRAPCTPHRRPPSGSRWSPCSTSLAFHHLDHSHSNRERSPPPEPEPSLSFCSELLSYLRYVPRLFDQRPRLVRRRCREIRHYFQSFLVNCPRCSHPTHQMDPGRSLVFCLEGWKWSVSDRFWLVIH